MQSVSALIYSVCIGLALSAGQAASADDAQLIQGKWRVLKLVEAGRELPPDQADKSEVEFTKEKFRLILPEATVEFPYTLDPAKSPKWIDMDPMQAARYGAGIYELTGDDLKLCLGHPRVPTRPDAFESKPMSFNNYLLVLKRKKP